MQYCYNSRMLSAPITQALAPSPDFPPGLTMAALLTENTALKGTLAEMQLLVEKLKFQLAQLNRYRFGASAEGYAQIPLWPTEPEQAGTPPEPVATQVPAHARKRPVRAPLPDSLPREVREIDLPEGERPCPCCGGERHVMGEEVSEKLDVTPARFSVIQFRRKTYACEACADGSGITTAPMPPQLIEQGLATPGLLAHVAVQKFCDHLPLARQERIFARQGIELPRSTLSDWMLTLGDRLAPLTARLGEILLTTDFLGSDDTILPWHPGKSGAGKTSQARLWVWQARIEECPLTLFQFAEDRSGKHPQDFLRGWRGYLQADAYAGYDAVFADGKIVEVGCWAHARRKFFEIAKAAQTPGLAHRIVDRLGELFTIDKAAREEGLDPPALKPRRLERAPHLLSGLKEELESALPGLPPKGPLALAIGYTLKNWVALTRYLEDGRLPMTNNAVERAIRPVAVGRKNFLFVASRRGGEAAAALYSLIESARACGHNPYLYLRDILARLPTTLNQDIDSLLPHRWNPLTA